MRRRSIPRPVLIMVLAAVLMIVGAAVVLALNAYFSPHCVPADGLAAIRPGMTKDEVIRLLGPPQRFIADSSNHHHLAYWKALRWCSVDVHLDGEDRVQGYQEASVFHDH